MSADLLIGCCILEGKTDFDYEGTDYCCDRASPLLPGRGIPTVYLGLVRLPNKFSLLILLVMSIYVESPAKEVPNFSPKPRMLLRLIVPS